MDDVHEILRLKYGERVRHFSTEESKRAERILGEMNARGALQSGARYMQTYELRLEYAGKRVDAFLESIQELVALGYITASDKPEPIALSHLENVMNDLRGDLLSRMEKEPGLKTMALKDDLLQQLANDLEKLDASARNRLRILFFDEGQRAKIDRSGPITIGTLNVTGIANFGEIAGDINQGIHHTETSGHKEVAEFLEELTRRLSSAETRLGPNERQEAIENIATIAQEAGNLPEKRRIGAVKAALTYLPSLLSASTDLLNYFNVRVADIRSFFEI